VQQLKTTTGNGGNSRYNLRCHFLHICSLPWPVTVHSRFAVNNMSAESRWAATENDGSSSSSRGGRTRATRWQSRSSAGNRGRNVDDRSDHWRSPDNSTRASSYQSRKDYGGSRQQNSPSYRRESPGMQHANHPRFALDLTCCLHHPLSCRYRENFSTNGYVEHIRGSWRNAEKYKELGRRTPGT
jgi:hypothetical protein